MNQHPSVMFEIIAKDQETMKAFYASVFGWQYRTGTANFAYVDFALSAVPLLGGIGQTDPKVPGFEPGHRFYLRVDDLEATIDRAVAAGGQRHMDPSCVDGYHFAMVRDPEGNLLGLIQPFSV